MDDLFFQALTFQFVGNERCGGLQKPECYITLAIFRNPGLTGIPIFLILIQLENFNGMTYGGIIFRRKVRARFNFQSIEIHLEPTGL